MADTLSCSCHIIFGSRINSSGVRTIQDVSMSRCREACRSRSACTAVNFRRSVGYCVLLEENITNSAVDVDPRMVYSFKITWQEMTPSPSCNTQCTDTEVCHVDGGQTTCNIEECGHPNTTQFETRNIYGNLRHVDSKVLYEMICTDILTGDPVYRNISGLCETNGNWSTENISCTANISNYVTQEGCYLDDSVNRALPDDFLSDGAMTITMCAQYCHVNGHLYFGVQFRAECFCGFTFNNLGTSDQCTMSCDGNPSEICGGALAINVYTYQ